MEKDKFYEHTTADMICCGECWSDDIAKTESGEYVDDECVYAKDLIRLSDDDPYQCDGCGKQNEAYDE